MVFWQLFSNHVSLEIVSDAFDKDADNQLSSNRATSMGCLDVSEEINGGDGNKPDGSGDDMMNVIKDRITGLIHEYDTIRTHLLF